MRARDVETRQAVMDYRMKQFRRRKIDVADVAEKIFDPKNTVEQYQEFGLIDEIATYDQIIARDFEKTQRAININVNSRFSLAGRN